MERQHGGGLGPLTPWSRVFAPALPGKENSASGSLAPFLLKACPLDRQAWPEIRILVLPESADLRINIVGRFLAH